MTTESPELDDLLARIKRKERRSQLATVLYTLVPTILVAAIVILVMAQIHKADVAVAEAEADAKERIKDARIEEEQWRSRELQTQIKALIDGPVQAYARPGQFGGRLVTKKTFGEALREWEEFLSLYWGELPLIETGEFAVAMAAFRSEMLKEDPDRSQLQDLANEIATQRDFALDELDTETQQD